MSALQADKLRDAIRLLTAFIKAHPKHPEALVSLGVAQMRAGDLLSAEAALREAASLPDAVPEAALNIEILKKMKRESSAGAPVPSSVAPGPEPRRVAESDTKSRPGIHSDPAYEVLRPGKVLYTTKRKAGSFICTSLAIPVTLLLIAVLFFLGGNLVIPVTLPMMVLPFFLWGVLVLRSRSYQYTVSEHRIDIRYGVINTREKRIWLWQIESVDFSQNLWEKIVNTATIRFHLERTDVGPTYDISGFDTKDGVMKLFDELVDVTVNDRRPIKGIWI